MKVRAYFINLDRAADRRAHMVAQAQRHGLDLHRVPAVDAALTTGPRDAHYRPHSHRHGRWELRGFEIAVFGSHRAVWHRFVDSGAAFAIVMEDDLILAADFSDRVADILASGFAFDIVRLNTSDQVRHFGRAKTPAPGVTLRPILEEMADSGCYLITASASAALLAGSEVFCDHVDDYIFSPERGLRTFQLIPPIAGQVIHEAKASDEWAKAGISVSDRLDTERRAASKGPLAYRVRKEGKRMARRLKQRWQRAAQGAERLHLRALSHHIEDPKTPDETAR